MNNKLKTGLKIAGGVAAAGGLAALGIANPALAKTALGAIKSGALKAGSAVGRGAKTVAGVAASNPYMTMMMAQPVINGARNALAKKQAELEYEESNMQNTNKINGENKNMSEYNFGGKGSGRRSSKVKKALLGLGATALAGAGAYGLYKAGGVSGLQSMGNKLADYYKANGAGATAAKLASIAKDKAQIAAKAGYDTGKDLAIKLDDKYDIKRRVAEGKDYKLNRAKEVAAEKASRAADEASRARIAAATEYRNSPEYAKNLAKGQESLKYAAKERIDNINDNIRDTASNSKIALRKIYEHVHDTKRKLADTLAARDAEAKAKYDEMRKTIKKPSGTPLYLPGERDEYYKKVTSSGDPLSHMVGHGEDHKVASSSDPLSHMVGRGPDAKPSINEKIYRNNYDPTSEAARLARKARREAKLAKENAYYDQDLSKYN